MFTADPQWMLVIIAACIAILTLMERRTSTLQLSKVEVKREQQDKRR